jgi:hypothetical protein
MRLLTSVVFAVALSAAAGLTSTWRAEPVTVDGLAPEWPNVQPIDRGPLVAAANDGDDLYLVVSARDPDTIALLSNGLIVWLDPAGRRAQTFGIRIPGVEQPPLPGMTPTASASSTAVRASVLDRFDVLGPGENQRRLVDITPDLGIALASSRAEGDVTYELKVPLQKSSARPHAVGASPGRTIGLGLATPVAPVNAN